MSPSDPAPFPNRQARKECWANRDTYYACLDSNSVVGAGSEPKGVCSSEKVRYEDSCAKSWIDYFNKRRILEAQLRERLLRDQAKGIDVSGLRYGPDDPRKNYSSRG